MEERVLATGHLIQLKKGELLFKENDDSHEFFIVKKGNVRISVPSTGK